MCRTKVRYYYDPDIRKNETGQYMVDIYADIKKKGIYVKTMKNNNSLALMRDVHNEIRNLSDSFPYVPNCVCALWFNSNCR